MSDILTPPHNLEAERGILGSILIDASMGDSRVLDLCIENGITEDAFFSPVNRLLFETMLGMQKEMITIDALTLNERLRQIKRLDSICGPATIQALIEETPVAAHAEYYINIVREKYLLRRVIECARKAEQRCFTFSAMASATGFP